MKHDTEKEAGTHILKSYGLFFKVQYQDLLTISHGQSWEDNKTFAAIQMFIDPQELVSVAELVSSDNTLMTKVLSVLSSLCVEVMELRKEAFER